MSARKSKDDAEKKPKRKGRQVNVWIKTELRNALDKMIARTRRDLTAEVSIALEEYLAKHGLWESDEPTEEDN